MTSAFYPRRLALLAALASTLWLAACGGGGSGSGGGSATVRALNVASDLPSSDVYIGGNKQFAALVNDAVTANITVDANTYTINVNSVGDAAALLSNSYALTKDKHYTAIVWGRQTALRLTTLPEDEDAALITAGNTRLRFFNATVDTGSLDVFVTAATVDLGDATPTQASLTTGTLGGFRDLSAGTYRLRVTGAGDPNDVRLDIPSITLPGGVYTTLMLTAGGGGVLVNGTLIQQQAAVTSLKNTNARVRVVASVPSAGNVGVSFGITPLVGSLRSPGIGPYTSIAAGTQTPTVTINGAALPSFTTTLVPGADYTMLVHRDTANVAKVALLTDDNRLPSVTTRSKIRIVNGTGSVDALTMQVDYLTQAATSNIASGAASTYATIISTGSARLDITSPSAIDPLFTTTAATGTSLLQPQGVYTVFMLGGQTAPSGRLSRDR